MAQNVTLYNLLISCPGDIKEEVTLIESAVDEFDELYAETLGITIKTRHWSKSSYSNQRFLSVLPMLFFFVLSGHEKYLQSNRFLYLICLL